MSSDVNIHQHQPGTSTVSSPPVSTQQAQTESVANVPTPVKAFGRTYQIKRFSLYQFACSLNYITPLSALLQGLVRSGSAKPNPDALTESEQIELAAYMESASPAFRDRVQRALPPQTYTDRSEWIPAIVGALSMSGDSMMGLISVATYEPLEFLQHEDRDPFEGIELLSVIVEKNLDFFSEANIARLTAIVEHLTPKITALYGAVLTTSPTTATTT